jgi:hypothetical protein
MRATVAELIVSSLRSLGLRYPQVDTEARTRFDEIRALLENE